MKRILVLLVSCLALFPEFVFAKKKVGDAQQLLGQSLNGTGLSTNDVSTSVGVIIQGVLGAVGLVFFVLMFYGGALWLLARGNEEQVAKAKRVVTSSVIGLIVIVASYAITNFITSRFTG